MDQYRIPLAEKNNHRFNNSASAGVHNIYLQTWLNYGIIGFLAYLGIVFGFLLICILSLRRVEPQVGKAIFWGALAGVSGFMVAGVFENNFRDGEVQLSSDDDGFGASSSLSVEKLEITCFSAKPPILFSVYINTLLQAR